MYECRAGEHPTTLRENLLMTFSMDWSILIKMRYYEDCRACVKRFVGETVTLSGAPEELHDTCEQMMGRLWAKRMPPHDVACEIMRFVQGETGVADPYASMKSKEVEDARQALHTLEGRFPETLDGALKLSAIGNATDHFVTEGYSDLVAFSFALGTTGIEREILRRNSAVLVLADNCGEFLFDLRLIRLLEGLGREVYYAVKHHPVMNDLCLSDVRRFKFDKLFDRFLAIGTPEIGIKPEGMVGTTKEIWESDATVIAKGMANYTTTSESSPRRRVIHIMRAKCEPVADSIAVSPGTYCAMVLP